jgi:hypothetical protein
MVREIRSEERVWPRETSSEEVWNANSRSVAAGKSSIVLMAWLECAAKESLGLEEIPPCPCLQRSRFLSSRHTGQSD